MAKAKKLELDAQHEQLTADVKGLVEKYRSSFSASTHGRFAEL